MSQIRILLPDKSIIHEVPRTMADDVQDNSIIKGADTVTICNTIVYSFSTSSLNNILLPACACVGHGPVILDFQAGIVRDRSEGMWCMDDSANTSSTRPVYASGKRRLAEM